MFAKYGNGSERSLVGFCDAQLYSLSSAELHLEHFLSSV